MPIYEFRCETCGKKHEALCRVSEDHSSRECPHCGSKKVHKLMSCFRALGTDGGGKSCSTCSSGSCSGCR